MTIPNASTLPLLELGGDPYERGLVHGRELAGAIAENVETYLARFAVSGLGAEAAVRTRRDLSNASGSKDAPQEGQTGGATVRS